jgi:hypothetical protein
VEIFGVLDADLLQRLQAICGETRGQHGEALDALAGEGLCGTPALF